MPGATGIRGDRMRSLLAEVLARLDGLTIDPAEVHIEVPPTRDPIVTLRFARVADIEHYASADKATVESRHIVLAHHGGRYIEHTAMYDRPGRRMLLRCLVFPHSPDWPGDAA